MKVDKEKEGKEMKKTLAGFTALAIIGILTIGSASSVFAAGISQEDAQKTAVAAAGVNEKDILFSKTAKGFDDGREIYEIDFIIPGESKYEFDIDAATGAILDQGMDYWEAEDDFEYAALIKEHAQTKGTAKSAPTGEITEEKAKEIALKDAGLKAANVTFTKCAKDMDDGIARYEVSFRTADGMEYEYDLSIDTGAILEKNAEFDD